MLFLHLARQNCKAFSKNLNLDDSVISLHTFAFRTNFKLHIISVTLKLVKKVVTSLDSSKVSCANFIPVVVLIKHEARLS